MLLNDPIERGLKIAYPRGRGILRVGGKDLEEMTPQDDLALGHRRTQIGVADGHNVQLAR